MSHPDMPWDPCGMKDPEEVSELMRDLVEDLNLYLTGGVVSVELAVSFVGSMEQSTVLLTDLNGAVTSPSLNEDASETLRLLRGAMYREDFGTWFSARLVLDLEESPAADFNYHEPPPMAFKFPSSLFAADLDRFPRSTNNIPGWLRRELDETVIN